MGLKHYETNGYSELHMCVYKEAKLSFTVLRKN